MIITKRSILDVAAALDPPLLTFLIERAKNMETNFYSGVESLSQEFMSSDFNIFSLAILKLIL